MAEFCNHDIFIPRMLQDEDLVLEFVECAPHTVHKVSTYYFRTVLANSGEELGGINPRVGSNVHIELYAGHIGFAVHAGHWRHRCAARSLRLLIPPAGIFASIRYA
jgi:tagatose 1,6-diphosphate aldolase